MVKNELVHMYEALQTLANESRQVPASIGVHSTLWDVSDVKTDKYP